MRGKKRKIRKHIKLQKGENKEIQHGFYNNSRKIREKSNIVRDTSWQSSKMKRKSKSSYRKLYKAPNR